MPFNAFVFFLSHTVSLTYTQNAIQLSFRFKALVSFYRIYSITKQLLQLILQLLLSSYPSIWSFFCLPLSFISKDKFLLVSLFNLSSFHATFHLVFCLIIISIPFLVLMFFFPIRHLHILLVLSPLVV